MFAVTSPKRFLRSPLRLLLLVAVTVLVVSSCSSGDITSTRELKTATSSSEAPADETQPETTDDVTADDPVDETEWPGESFELFATEGDVLSVVGVQFDDVLNIRSGPGTEFQILTSLEPTETAVATGQAWQNNGFWYEVTVGDETGWAASSFFAYLGPTDDATAEIIQPGDVFQTETMLEMGELVAATQVSEDPPSTITQISSPIVGDLGEVMYDVIGLGDDAVYGYRLHIFGQENETGDFFDLKNVERTTLCGRGLTDGLCS